jgi:hypothetical protein
MELPSNNWLQQNHLHDSSEVLSLPNPSKDNEKNLLPEHELQTK